MSTTSFSTSSPQTVKVWAKKAFSDAVKATMYGKLLGKSDRSIVQIKDDLKKGEGDRVRFRLRMLPQGIGVQDSETLEGKEESLDYRYFDVNLGEKRHAFQVELNLSEQRTMADVRTDMKDAQAEWLEEYIDTTFFEVLSGAGVGPAGASKYHPSGMLGGNALSAPSSDRIVYGGTGVAAKASLAVTDVMTLTVLDKLKERAKLTTPAMRPGNFDGQNKYVAILHPWQVTSMRTNTSTGQWLDIQKAAMMGGKVSDNPIWSSALGVYNDIIITESTRIPTFTDYGAGANISAARGLFLGAQAAVAAYGLGTDDKGVLKTVEKEKDYGKYLGSGMTLIWALVKAKFDQQSDFAVFAFDTAAKQAV